MAGNTRGKLKEHFEGIHRNFEWIVTHIDKSMALIEGQLQFTEAMTKVKGDTDKMQEVLNQYPLYQGLQALAKGIQTMDELTQSLYSTI